MLEYNLDGLIGPTHFFGGLGVGNVASMESAGNVSHPKSAALQGLAKMKLMHDLGVAQLVMPPHLRPALHVLRGKGYIGSPAEMLAEVIQHEPEMLPIIYSSSAMWTANAATVSASADTADGKLHLTPANLSSNAHRRIEASFTARLLQRIFAGDCFIHHPPLADTPDMRDEGAANHMRLVPQQSSLRGAERRGNPGGEHNKLGMLPWIAASASPPRNDRVGGDDGVNIFVYGTGDGADGPSHYTARQYRTASETIAAQHGLDAARVLFLQQHPAAIDAGVFHNDVIATSHGHAVFYHQQAFVDDAPLVAMAAQFGLQLFKVTAQDLPLAEAVSTYLFNSQMVTTADGSMVLVAPRQCEKSGAVQAVVAAWIADAQCPIAAAYYIDVDQSMANGGGPACLRLRVPMTEDEASQIHPGVVFSTALFEQLGNVISDDYPEQMSRDQLLDVEFSSRVLPIYGAIARVLGLPDVYEGWV